jgi:polysaccharide pyruvyl transferase WcaK-like protein
VKLVVFNVKYSPNLGDGVLASCLERGLRQGGPDISVETLDLAGRCDFGAPRSRRLYALSLLQILPKGLRGAMVELALRRRFAALKEHWHRRIDEADAVIIGGGNLFQDDDLNFPLKIAAVLDQVQRAQKPLAIFAVGATGHWSERAKVLFDRLRDCKVVHVSVRDHGARENWLKHFGHFFPVEVSPDPALLAASLIGGTISHSGKAPLVGIGVVHPLVLRRHAAIEQAQIPLSKNADYRLLIRWFLDAGCRVALFTNGAEEDEQFLRAILDDRSAQAWLRDGSLSVMPHPKTPEELVTNISRLSVVIAHRLHASIVSYSLGVPCVGLSWDQKVDGFFSEINREAFVISGEGVSPAQVGETALRALQEGLDPLKQARLVRKARFCLFHMIEKLRSATFRPASDRAVL